MRLQRLKCAVGVCVHVELGAVRGEDAAVGVDHERRPPIEQRSRVLHPELPRNDAVRVGQERQTERVAPVELGLRHRSLAADPLELGSQVAEVTALGGAAACDRGSRVEEHDHRSALQLPGERDRPAGLVGQGELRCGVAL